MADAEPRVTTLAASTLGGPGAPDPRRCSDNALAVLGEAAGADMRMASLSLDVTSHLLEERAVEVVVRVDKRARSIVFASAEARSGGKLVYSAQGLFSRAG